LNKKIIPYLAAFGTVLLWSSAFPAVRYTLVYFSPEGLMSFRFIIAAIVLIIYVIVKKIPFPKTKDLPFFLLSSFMGLFVYMWAFNTGSVHVVSGVSGFIIASSPVFTLILSIIFLKEKAGFKCWLGVILSFCGIIIIAISQVTDLELNIGIWLLVLAAVSTSVFNITQKKILKSYTTIEATAYTIIFGAAQMLIFAPNIITEAPAASVSSIFVVVYLGIFPAALAYFLWNFALKRTEKTVHVTSVLYLSPFLASLIAFIWLGEVIPALAFVGGIIVIIGMVITNISRNKKEELGET